MELWTI